MKILIVVLILFAAGALAGFFVRKKSNKPGSDKPGGYSDLEESDEHRTT